MIDQYIRAGATKLGISAEEYAAHVDRGEKWCAACKDWHPLDAFGRDRNQASGRSSRCLSADAAMKRVRAAARRGERTRRRTSDQVDLLHEVYTMAAAKVPHAEIMDTIRAAVGRP